MRGHAFIAEMSPGAFDSYAKQFALERMQPLDDAAAARVRGDAHPDVVHVRLDGASVKIDQIRDVIADTAQKPYEGGKRVICIHHADSMTQQAQNALLKSLEEPLECNTFLLLCKSAGQLLPTVRSRCTLVRAETGGKLDAALAAGADKALADVIAGISSDAAHAAEYARSAAEGEGIWSIRAQAFQVLDRLQNGGEPIQCAKDLPEDRQQLKQAASSMMLFFSDAMRQGAGYDKIYNNDYSAMIAYWRGRSPRKAAECADACKQVASMLDSNVSPKICASWLCISISEVME